MKLPAFLLFTSIVLLGAGCSQPETSVMTPEEETVPVAQEPVELPNGASVETGQVVTTFALNEMAGCEINLAYPVISDEAFPAATQKVLNEKINAFLAAALETTAAKISANGVDAAAETYAASCESQITEEYNSQSEGGEEFFTNLKHEVNTTYEVTLHDHDVLSLVLHNYSYTGGAHPNQNTEAINLDTTTGELLTAEDLILVDNLQAFFQVEAQKLLDEKRDVLYPEAADELQALINSHPNSWSSAQMEVFGQFSDFYITPSAVVVFYNAYDIAPYAAGDVEVKVPFTDLKPFVNPDSRFAEIVNS